MKIESEMNSGTETQLISDRMDLVSEGFIARIRSRHSDLSKGDLRLCTLMKLNLSVKEIAQNLHVSPAAIEKRRYRLKKKLALGAEDSLDEYVLEF